MKSWRLERSHIHDRGQQQEFDVPGEALIEEQFHFKAAVKLVLASSIAAIASRLVRLLTEPPPSWRLAQP